MPAPHTLYSKMLAERIAPRNVLVLFYFILFIPVVIYKLAALNTFMAFDCELKKFPIGMLELPKLRTLDLHINDISCFGSIL